MAIKSGTRNGVGKSLGGEKARRKGNLTVTREPKAQKLW